MPRRTIAGTGKKLPMNMRTTAELRGKIERAAGQSGRSLVQEVEHRVERSFYNDDVVAAMTTLFGYIGDRLDHLDYLSDRQSDLLQAIAKGLTDWPMDRGDRTVLDRSLHACEARDG